VLIVDDVDETRELLCWQLATDPALRVVGEANNGATALVEAARLRPDVVILDLYMPTLSGFQTMPELQKLLPEARVVVMTSFDSPRAETASAELGAAAYVVKGIKRRELLRAVRRAAGLA